MSRTRLKQVNPEWTADLAYVVGLMTTDGNLSPDGRHLGLVSKDREQVERVKALLHLSNRVGQKNSSHHPDGVYWTLQFVSVVLYRWLMEIGLMPNKSKQLGALLVPDICFFDFLRGHLDGDGTIRVYSDPVYRNAQRLYVVFHSASRPHLDWIQSTAERLIGIGGYIDAVPGVWRLNYAKQESLKLLPMMYYHVDLPCLQRKRDLVKHLL